MEVNDYSTPTSPLVHKGSILPRATSRVVVNVVNLDLAS
jgi:hypothetical protein